MKPAQTTRWRTGALSELSRFLCRMDRIEVQLDEMDRLAALPDAELATRADAVSAWSVAQQLQHVARANHSLARGLLGLLDDPTRGRPVAPNLLGRIVLFLGYIPRGRGKAPSSTRAEEEPTVEGVRGEVAAARELLHRWRERAPDLLALDASISHPYFGCPSVPQWLRFVEVHNAHHLRIMRDIRAAG